MPELLNVEIFEEILYHISCNPKISFENLSSQVGVRLSTIQVALQILENLAIIIKLKNSYKIGQTAQQRLNIKECQARRVCYQCEGRGILVPFQEFEQAYGELISKRVPPDRSLNQWQADLKSVCARVAFLIQDRSVRRKRILFTGDSDFASVGVALYGNPKEVVVIDIDERIVKEYPEIAEEYNIPLKVIKHDLTEELPPDLQDSFDTTFGDPPYAYKGITTWLLRAIEGLKPHGRGYLAIPYSDALLQGPSIMTCVSDCLHNKNFTITNLVHGFHSYEGVDGQRSSMLRFEQVRPEYNLPSDFYWGEKITAEGRVNKPEWDNPSVNQYLNYLAGAADSYPVE